VESMRFSAASARAMVSSSLYSSLGVRFMPTTGPLSFRDDYTQLMGRAQSQWAALEVITDYAIGKFLKVTEGQAHLITSGLTFGRKGRLLADLVAKSDDPQKSAILGAFNKLRGMGKRDMFAHSYLRSTKDTITFLDRSVSGEFSAKEHTFTLDEFRAYVMDFETAIGAFRASLGATREQLDAFAKAALSLSRNSKTSSGKPKESA
jgi:hypothetical protein